MRLPLFPATLMYGRRRLSPLEAALYAAAVGVLIAVFLSAGLKYMELAEKASMEATLSVVASAIDTRLATDVLRGASPPTDWSGRNPFELARTAPPGFLGELGTRELASLERPSWVFDSRSGELIYLPWLRRGLRGGDADGALHFRLAARGKAAGYWLVATSRYEWDPLE